MKKLNGFQKFENQKLNLNRVHGGAADGLTIVGKQGGTFALGKDASTNEKDKVDSGPIVVGPVEL